MSAVMGTGILARAAADPGDSPSRKTRRSSPAAGNPSRSTFFVRPQDRGCGRMNLAHAQTRRYDLDWVRICAFALLILYHVGMYYVTWDWHVKSPRASSALEPLMLLVNPWRLPLLFLVSGAATAFMLARGTKGLAGMRSKRLLIPLVFGMLVVVPPQSYFEVVEQVHYDGSYWQFWARYLAFDGSFCDHDGCLKLPTWNHLWFVVYLWVYTMVTLLALRIAPRDLLDRLSQRLER